MIEFKKVGEKLFSIQADGGNVVRLPRRYTPYPSSKADHIMLINPENPSYASYLYSHIIIDGIACVSVDDAIERLIVITKGSNE